LIVGLDLALFGMFDQDAFETEDPSPRAGPRSRHHLILMSPISRLTDRH
jgi:hypothetical protein